MITTRQAAVHDLDKLATLFDLYRVFYKKDSDKESVKEFLKDRIENNESVIFIAEDEDKTLSGFVQLYPLFSSTRMQRLWLLNDLYVLASSRGKGISVLLIDKAKEHCKLSKGCGLMLETAKSNVIGNQLYPRTSFELDTDHNYYFWEA